MVKFALVSAILGLLPLFASLQTPFSKEVDAVIFDCDGVLVDTEYLKFLAWQKALDAHNISFSLEEYKPLVGHSSKNILLMMKKLKGQEISEEVIALRTQLYQNLQAQGVPPIQEMVDFARRLSLDKHSLGIKLGLASSASREEIVQNLAQIGLLDAFDVVISGHDDLGDYVDPEGKNKPKPYIYLEAAKRLGIEPSRCLVIEDTQAGIEAAFGAWMIPIAVPNRYTEGQDFSKAAKIFWSYSELISVAP